MRKNDRKKFIVCIHDVSPRFQCDIETLITAVAPYTGDRISLGIVPNWHGLFPLTDYPDFLSSYPEYEVLLHGYYHERRKGWGPASILSSHSDEMNGITQENIDTFLQAGQDLLQSALGRTAPGFLPPAWQGGGHPHEVFWQKKFKYIVGHSSLIGQSGIELPLCTWSWGAGQSDMMGYLGDYYGKIRSLLPDSPIHVIALHPQQASNRFLSRALSLLEKLSLEGFEAQVFENLLI